MASPCNPPATRLIALGASNLARNALALLDAARSHANGPVEVHAALGRGRSFGISSRLLGRGLAGIDGCGIWRGLEGLAPRPTTALVMDVGNDVLYGIEVPRILAWVEHALKRLRRHAQRIAVVGLPMATLATLPAWRFTLVRSVLVPSCRLTLPQVLAAAELLQAGLEPLAQRYGASFHTLPASWYGFDPMHFQRRFARTAVRQWLGVPLDAGAAGRSFDGLLGRLAFLFARPAQRTLLGQVQQHAQPARTWPCGTTLSLW